MYIILHYILMSMYDYCMHVSVHIYIYIYLSLSLCACACYIYIYKSQIHVYLTQFLGSAESWLASIFNWRSGLHPEGDGRGASRETEMVSVCPSGLKLVMKCNYITCLPCTRKCLWNSAHWSYCWTWTRIKKKKTHIPRPVLEHVRCNPDVAPHLTSGGYEDKVDVITPIIILFRGGG